MSKMEYVRDRSNPKQMQRIVKFMEDNPEFARQRVRGTNYPPICKTMWLRLTADLNNLGPPVRDWQSWRRVWCDFKSSIQKKLKQSERYTARGMAPPRNLALSANQERINNLLSDGIYQPRRRTPGNSAERRQTRSSGRFVEKYVKDEDSHSRDGTLSEYENYSESESLTEEATETAKEPKEQLDLLDKMHSFEERLLKMEERRLQIEAERLRIEKRRLEIEESRFAREEARFTEEAISVDRMVPH